MITVRKYKDEDWQAITDATEPFTPLKAPDEFLHISNRSVAVTGIENNRIMACGGITFITNDEGLVWVKISDKCNEKPYTWAKAIVETFRLMMDSIEDLNVSTYVVRNFCKGDKLARLIGMRKTDETVNHNGNVYCKYKAVI